MSIVSLITRECTKDFQKKLVVIDEGWAILQSQHAAGFVELMFRTFRKYNAACVLISQRAQDLSGRSAEAIRDNVYNKFLLKQSRDVAEHIREALKLSDEQVAEIGRLKQVKGLYSEFLYVNDRDEGVYRLFQTPDVYALTTTNPEDIRRKNGISEPATSGIRTV